MFVFTIYYGMASKKNSKNILPDRLSSTIGTRVFKVYDDLGGWFTTIPAKSERPGGIIRIWAPKTSKVGNKYSNELAYNMGSLITMQFPDDRTTETNLYYSIGQNDMTHIFWDIDNIDGAVRYLWLITRKANITEELELRQYVREVLTEEETYEPTLMVRIARDNPRNLVTYEDIGGWMSADLGQSSVKGIYQPTKHLNKSGKPLKGYGYRMASILRGGTGYITFHKESKDVSRLVYLDNKGGKHWVPWDFDDVENAVRFVYLQNIMPASKIQSEPLNEGDDNKVRAKGVPGWFAKREEPGKGSSIGYWMIFDDTGKDIAAIYDDGTLFFGRFDTSDEKDRPELANNPKQTIRYIWLKLMAKKKASSIQSIEPLTEVIDALIPEWQAIDLGNDTFYRYKINDEQGRRMAVIGKYGLLFRTMNPGGRLEKDDSYELVDVNDTESINQAMRYVYMMSKQPRP
jgi:hypothetical protein